MDTEELGITVLVMLVIMGVIIGLFFLFGAIAGPDEVNERGRYVYDDAKKLTFESSLAINSYLLGIDRRSGYEFVVVLPDHTMTEEQIIDRFNSLGVGKQGKDNGAALFIFPDNSWFMAIGSGNDKVSVPYSKTQGDKILKGINDDPTGSILKFVDVMGKKLDAYPDPIKIGESATGLVVHNMGLILLWVTFIALIIFLLKQRDGFQSDDLIIPIALFVCLGVFFGVNLLVFNFSDNAPTGYTDYGIITSTDKGSYMYVTYICTGGKVRTCTPIWHTVYTNDVQFISYEMKYYKYRFSTTDWRGAWDHNPGELDKIGVNSDSSHLSWAGGFNDISGGKTIGDGVWS